MENGRIIIMDDGFMWKPIPTDRARDLLLMGAFDIYVIYYADQTESLIENIQEFDNAATGNHGVFAIELGNIYNTCLSGVKPMQNVQEITLQAVDQLVNFADCSRDEAQDIALQWGLDFTEKYRDYNYDGDYYDLIDEYVEYRFEDGGYNVPSTPSRKPKQAPVLGAVLGDISPLDLKQIEALQEISVLAVNPLNYSGHCTHGEAVELAREWAKEFHDIEVAHTYDGEKYYDDLASEFVKSKLQELGIDFNIASDVPGLYGATLQAMTLDMYDQISEYFADDTTAACDLIANWTVEFLEMPDTPDRGKARQEFMERKVKELEDEDRALSLMFPDIKFGIGQKVWRMENNRPVVSVVNAIHASQSRVAYELADGEVLLAASLFKSRAALLSSL